MKNGSYRVHMHRHRLKSDDEEKRVPNRAADDETFRDTYNNNRPKDFPELTLEEASVINKFNGKQFMFMKTVKSKLASDRRASMEEEIRQLKARISDLEARNPSKNSNTGKVTPAERVKTVFDKLKKGSIVIKSNVTEIEGVNVDELAAYALKMSKE